MMSQTNLTLALIPLSGLIMNVALFIAMRRIWPELNYLIALILAFAAGLVPTMLWTATELDQMLFSTDALSILLLNFLSYSGLGYCWFTVVNPCATAVRIRILSVALRSSEGVISRSEIREIYNAERMLDNRLGRLLAWGQIEPVPGDPAGRYRAKRNAVFPVLHAGIIRLKRLVFGKAYRGQ
jgi:hypothetical protein